MRRLFVTLALICGFTLGYGCGGSGSNDLDEVSGQRCRVSSNCPVGEFCQEGICVEDLGCTPESCGLGELCTDDFECVDVAEVCATTPGGCECHILNSSGNYEAAPNSVPNIVLPAGESLEVTAVLATKVAGTTIPGVSFEASVDDANVFAVSGTTLTAQPSVHTAQAVLTAKFGSTECTADLVNIGAGPEGKTVRFYVVDDTTNQPVPNAKVIVDRYQEISVGPDGVDDGAAAPTNELGLTLTTDNSESDLYAVTVFASGYNILSVVGLNTGDGNDVMLPLSARSATPKTGGFTGQLDFETYEKRYLNSRPGAIKLGVVTASIPFKSLLNFNLDLFLGSITDANCDEIPRPAGCYPIKIANLVDQITALPGGLILGLASTMIKSHFDSVAKPGRRYAWGLGAELEIPDLTGIISMATPYLSECECDTSNECNEDGDSECACDTDCGLNIDVGAALADIIPLMSSFATGLKADIGLQSASVEEWENHISGDYNTSGRNTNPKFPKLDDGQGELGQLTLREGWSKFTALQVGQLPTDWGSDEAERKMEGLVALTGKNAPGYGFVPLGLGFGMDCTEGNCLDRSSDDAGIFDGIINGGPVCKFNIDQEKNKCSSTITDIAPQGILAEGKLPLFHSPAFGGLEGYTSRSMVLALPFSQLLAGNADDRGLRATAIMHTGTLANGDSPALSSRSFPGDPKIPTEMNGRTYVTANSNHDLHWVTMASAEDGTDTLTTRWNIYMLGSSSFTAPNIPDALSSDFEDPFVASTGGDIPQGKVSSTHIGFTLDEGASLAALSLNNGTSLNSIFGSVNGMSIETKNIPVNNQ